MRGTINFFVFLINILSSYPSSSFLLALSYSFWMALGPQFTIWRHIFVKLLTFVFLASSCAARFLTVCQVGNNFSCCFIWELLKQMSSISFCKYSAAGLCGYVSLLTLLFQGFAQKCFQKVKTCNHVAWPIHFPSLSLFWRGVKNSNRLVMFITLCHDEEPLFLQCRLVSL